MQIVDNKLLVVRTRRPHLVTEKIKRSKVVQVLVDGLHDVAVFWGLKEAQELATLKIKNVPSTITRDYDWPGRHRPFAHQKETAAFLTLRKKAFCFNEQGTGKTAAVIWAADYLMKAGLIRRVLIICPLSIMKSAWQADLFKFAVHRTVDVAYGRKDQRAKVILGDTEFVIINFDGVDIVNNASSIGLGSLHYAIDPSSAVVPAGVLTSTTLNLFLEQSQNVRTKRTDQVAKIYYKPKVGSQVQGGGITGKSTFCPWLKCAFSDATVFNGVHLFIQPGAGFSLNPYVKYDIFVTCYMQFRGNA